MQADKHCRRRSFRLAPSRLLALLLPPSPLIPRLIISASSADLLTAANLSGHQRSLRDDVLRPAVTALQASISPHDTRRPARLHASRPSNVGSLYTPYPTAPSE